MNNPTRRTTISVTYGIVTPESAECGEYDEMGYIVEPEDTNTCLSSAVKYLYQTRTCEVDGIEAEFADSWQGGININVYNSPEYVTGARETRTLHITNITKASQKRLCRVLGIKYEQ